ncbi:MAG: hypothetical protein FJZ57_08505, partial [Chlamydiae bacterium]|nr:hypothetical protein [Chlamydiota bacterium]
MYRLANILCTTICAFSLTHIFADDVGFIPEHEISLSSPLDSSDAMTGFTTEPSFTHSQTSLQGSEKASMSMSQMLASLEQPKVEAKKVVIKPFTG